MSLEVGRPVGDEGIADAVGLVECVPREWFDQVKHLGGKRTVKTLAQSSINKPVALLRHQGGNLLAHGLPHRVRLAQGIAGKPLQDQQHLVLVDDHTIGFVQEFLQAGMRISDAPASVLGLDESVNVLHRARTIQGNHGRDVAQVRGLQFLDVSLHPCAFQLEQVGCLARRKQIKGFLVVQGQAGHVNLYALGFIQQFRGPIKDGQVGQPQKVHLQQTQLGHRIHRVLRHQHRAVLVTPRGPLQGHRFRQWFVGDEHPGGVGADVVDNSLQTLGIVHQVLDGVVRLVSIGQLRVNPQRVIQGAGLERDHPGDPVHVPVTHAQAAAHISQGRLGAHSAEGNYLRHPVATVPVNYVVQHFVPPVILEVHVDIGHFLSLQVQEPLENQSVLQGVHVSNAQAVKGHAGRGAAPHAEHYVIAVHKIADIPHHQEVVGELSVADDLQFIVQAFLGLRSCPGVTASKAFPAQLRQIFVCRHAIRRRKLGQVRLSKAQFNVAHVGNQQGVSEGLGMVRKEVPHLCRALDVVGIVLHPQALFVLDRRVGLDADVQVLVRGLVLADVVGIVGNYQRDAQVPAQPSQRVIDSRQLFHVLVTLQFKEITVSEQIPVLEDLPAGILHPAVTQQPGHLGRGAP